MDAAAEAESLFVPCSASSLRCFEPFQHRARAEGLDLADAARAAMKFTRGPQEERLLALVRELREAAREKNLWLSLGRLARTDLSRLPELEALFADARRRAEAAGLDLRLPGLTAPEDASQRRCAFVENNAVFIDWRGQVSPCHFLWHGYACRILGDEKRVHPHSFGSIAEAPLEAIWQGPEFTAFRRAAAAGEYPACGDCDMGMCSDACGAAGPFEQDCLGVAVPCGHCPWSVGQLQCLGSERL
jgi:MoaA/NifB/PqqE/SkfB family radical SAM enzyme